MVDETKPYRLKEFDLVRLKFRDNDVIGLVFNVALDEHRDDRYVIFVYMQTVIGVATQSPVGPGLAISQVMFFTIDEKAETVTDIFDNEWELDHASCNYQFHDAHIAITYLWACKQLHSGRDEAWISKLYDRIINYTEVMVHNINVGMG